MAPRQRAHLFGPRGNLREDQLKSYVDAGFAVVAVDFRLAPETKLGEILHEKWGRVENLFLTGHLGLSGPSVDWFSSHFCVPQAHGDRL